MAIWVAVGGRGTLVGPVVGAWLVNATKSLFTVAAPETWLFVLGGTFVGVTLFAPRGLAGLADSLRRRPRERHPAPAEAPVPEKT
jgi:urea transport system permease protein